MEKDNVKRTKHHATTEQDTAALTVAYMFTQGHTQTQISDTLRISQAKVSRLFKEVKDRYTLRTFRSDLLDAATFQRIRNLASPNKLVERLKAIAPQKDGLALGPRNVHVIPLRSDVSRAERRAAFATGAAPILKEMIMGASGPVGVSWGNTIWHTTQALRDLPLERPWRPNDDVEFVPLCGDPLLTNYNAARTASRIASNLKELVRGDNGSSFWLGLVPAFRPKFRPGEIKTLDKYINLVPQYLRIFGPRGTNFRGKQPEGPPLAGQLSMIITGAGSAEYPIGFGSRSSPLLTLPPDQKQLLSNTIYGDIAGVLLVKQKSTAAGQRLAQRVQDSWTGLTFEHLRTCADRAFSTQSDPIKCPGITLLTFGPDRAPIVVEAVRQGLVGQLIIGSDIEENITEILDSQEDASLAVTQPGAS